MVDNEDAVGPLGRTKLTCFRDGDGVRNSKCRTGLKRGYCALCYVGFACTSATSVLSS